MILHLRCKTHSCPVTSAGEKLHFIEPLDKLGDFELDVADLYCMGDQSTFEYDDEKHVFVHEFVAFVEFGI
jgi:hypothetical protein